MAILHNFFVEYNAPNSLIDPEDRDDQLNELNYLCCNRTRHQGELGNHHVEVLKLFKGSN
jgi:hypothetical protein